MPLVFILRGQILSLRPSSSSQHDQGSSREIMDAFQLYLSYIQQVLPCSCLQCSPVPYSWVQEMALWGNALIRNRSGWSDHSHHLILLFRIGDLTSSHGQIMENQD